MLILQLPAVSTLCPSGILKVPPRPRALERGLEVINPNLL